MTRELTGLEKKIINRASRGIEISARPYEKIAEEVGCDEDVVIKTLGDLLKEKRIRRVAAILRQHELGYDANAMCVFDAPEEFVDEAGEYAASLAEVSHCYRRTRASGWPYNLYAMVHAATREACEETASKIARRARAGDFRTLYSVRELKKENMIYFEGGPGGKVND